MSIGRNSISSCSTATDDHRRFLGLVAAAIAASCFLLESKTSPARILLGQTSFHSEIQDDGTLFVPVAGDDDRQGQYTTESESESESENVLGVPESLCTDLIANHEAEGNITRLHVEAALCGDHSDSDVIPSFFYYNLVAHLSGLPFTFSCKDSKPGVSNLLQKSESSSINDFDPGYTLEEFCNEGSLHSKLSHGLPLVKNNLHRAAMAKADVVKPDDAVIHLYPNNVLDTENYSGEAGVGGLFGHAIYSQLLKIAEEDKGPIQTISILVTPANAEKSIDSVRGMDIPYVNERSAKIAEDLAKHLRSEFSGSTVIIRNDRETESSATRYARMIMVKKAVICGQSGSCVYPSVSVGNGVRSYIHYSNSVKDFIGHKIEQYNLIEAAAKNNNNIHLWDAPMLGNNQLRNMSEEDIFRFLRDCSVAVDPNVGFVDASTN